MRFFQNVCAAISGILEITTTGGRASAEVRAIIAQLDGIVPARDIDNALELVDAGEWGEALSLVCTQLHEHDLAISNKLHRRISACGEAMGMDAHEWSDICVNARGND